MRSLSSGDFGLPVIRRLRAAELSKNLLLVTALRQALSPLKLAGADLVEQASAVLAEVQARSPGAVAEVLALPHFGMWAADSLMRLRSTGPDQASAGPLSAHDLAPFSAFVAVAALRARHPFELRLPVRDGMVVLPSLGQAEIDRQFHSGWASIQSDGNNVLLSSAAGEMSLPADFGAESSRIWPNWTPIPRVRAEAEGLTLDAIIDTTDPFLARLGPVVDRVEFSWPARMVAAWAILARHHREVAAGLAKVLTTLVPLAEAPTGRPNSATSGWAWGAIGLSMVSDETLLAETLVHEFQHLALAAVEDLTPLIEAGTGELSYVAWRDDPRPAAAIAHGTFAQLAVTRYWRKQRQIARPADQSRCDIEFARGRRAALAGAITLGRSPLLTDAGRIVTRSMRDQLEAWEHESVPGQAESAAAEIAAEHYLRWRVAHLRPDEESVHLLATRWLEAGAEADGRPVPPVVLSPWTKNPGSELARLLDLAYRDPDRLSKLRGELDGLAIVHLELVSGDVERAREEYLRLVLTDGSAEAWIGLILAQRRLSGRPWSFPIADRPEIVVAVHDRIRALSDSAASGQPLVEWLAGNWLGLVDASR